MKGLPTPAIHERKGWAFMSFEVKTLSNLFISPGLILGTLFLNSLRLKTLSFWRNALT